MTILSDTEISQVRLAILGVTDKSKSLKWVKEAFEALCIELLKRRHDAQVANEARDQQDGQIRLLEMERDIVKDQYKEVCERLASFHKEMGALEVKNQIQAEAIEGYKAAEHHNSQLSREMHKELMALRTKFLGFICAECGALTGCSFDSIDNGTALKCDHCKKGSVVSLRRLGEKEGEELHRVAEWAMSAKNILDDHNGLLHETLKEYTRIGDNLRDVVLRLKSTVDLFRAGMKACLGTNTKPHKFVLVSTADGCPVCAVLSLVG